MRRENIGGNGAAAENEFRRSPALSISFDF